MLTFALPSREGLTHRPGDEGKRKKTLMSACREGKASYLCSPLRRKGSWAWKRKRSLSDGRRESEKKKFWKVLQREKKFLPLHPLRERSSADRVGKRNKEKKSCLRAWKRRNVPYLCSPSRQGGQDGERPSQVTGSRPVGSSLSEWEDRKKGQAAMLAQETRSVSAVERLTTSTVFIIVN